MTTTVGINKKARAAYKVLKTFEAGLVLKGPEVKSLRLGRVSFAGSFVSFVNERPHVINMNIGLYPKSSGKNYDPKRPRALLLQNHEIKELHGLSQQKGYTVVPLQIYFKNNIAKLEIGVVRGRKKKDIREELKKRAVNRDVEVATRGKI